MTVRHVALFSNGITSWSGCPCFINWNGWEPVAA